MPKIKSIHWKKFEKFLLYIGCEFVREKGDHRIYWKEGIKRPIIVPRYNPLPSFIILNNLRVLNITKEKYLEIYDQF
jgi:predicted RNA binding protein YcfA (HicA-like mRNA interferase family)